MSAPRPVVVLAEMPEAAGRDLSIERLHLPAGARIETFTYRGDAAALAIACRDAEAILTDYVPFDRAALSQLARCRIISVAATGWDCVDVAADAGLGGIFAIDPLWPALLVSVVLLAALTLLQPRQVARTTA